MHQPLILTARLDEQSQRYFNRLRSEYFPAERNYLDAHLTLFHALPGEALAEIRATLQALSGAFPLQAATSGLRFLGRGVAYEVSCPELVQVRRELAERWREWLTPQDAQGLRPHITVQNKVDPKVARALYGELRATFQTLPFQITGLDLWRYEGGPWTPV